MCLPGNTRINYVSMPAFLADNQNVPAGEAIAATRGFGKTRNLPLIGSSGARRTFYFG
jgi:hypothetical protein